MTAPVSVASRLLSILDVFAEPGARASLSLSEIAQRTGLPLSTVHRMLAELVEWGGLARRDDGRYTLGLRLWELGTRVPATRSLRAIALPFLEDLYEATHQHVHLAVLDGAEALYIEKLSAHRAVPVVSSVGARLPLHATGVGLVLLAHAPAEDLEEYVARDLPRFLPRTVTSPDALRRRLAEIRHCGVALSSEEMTAGTSSVAAPIRDRASRVVAALSVVTGSEPRPDDLLEREVRAAAAGVSRALGYRRSVVA
ncbi:MULTISPECIES: IclR family transcriptional regulator [unclassified Rathayibacter]|uniref:IclR family transcriptional regulator n=1 Tax=unclassified Rathayibacter TaxID=2609250 RepID=UPI000CE743DF|nr:MULTISPECIES: IclR family transcriptional regulator [unclassified Rathayibacter]PPF41074.1 IclR family transcriptional regulator [Rathayibacter sp. AY1A3]PPG92767.1 IclR family transcriptional regulator [Rathayibacter sp. AY1F3]PPI41682.1 IclR family transcriptional regulator [Rathayibacter sp. RFBD1]PPI63183.1 IclR family transcriptional regulator [Rathayibacter sp. TRS19]